MVEYADHCGAPQWTSPPKYSLGLHDSRTRIGDSHTGRRGCAAGLPQEIRRPQLGGQLGRQRQSLPTSDPIRVHANARYRVRFDNQSDEAHPVHLHRHSFEMTRFAEKATAGVLKDVIVVKQVRWISRQTIPAPRPGLNDARIFIPAAGMINLGLMRTLEQTTQEILELATKQFKVPAG